MTNTCASVRRRCRDAVLVSIIVTLVAGCAMAPPGETAARKVEIVRTDSGFDLHRDGEVYEIKGAGIDHGSIEALVAHGGNSLRTWRTDSPEEPGREILDRAERLGVSVVWCIEIGRERHGFDYNDEKAVVAQFEFARGEVLKNRDHPALLAWMIGNEPNLEATNPKVYDAVNDISRMIHELDPNHPTTTALAGFNGELAATLDARAPDLDFLSIQMYGDIVNLPQYIEEAGFDRPYFVTEWGAVGHWEVAKTTWGAPVEQDSSAKANSYLTAYETALQPFPDQVIGSYVFLWGQKQERTPTWYGMFLASGEETETVDVLHYIWTGQWPANRSPLMRSMLLDGKDAYENVTLQAGAQYTADALVEDPDGDAVSYRWEIMPESTATQIGGDKEVVPESLPGLIDSPSRSSVVLRAPDVPGPYRLFLYAFDGRNHGAHANIPFLVVQ